MLSHVLFERKLRIYQTCHRGPNAMFVHSELTSTHLLYNLADVPLQPTKLRTNLSERPAVCTNGKDAISTS